MDQKDVEPGGVYSWVSEWQIPTGLNWSEHCEGVWVIDTHEGVSLWTEKNKSRIGETWVALCTGIFLANLPVYLVACVHKIER